MGLWHKPRCSASVKIAVRRKEGWGGGDVNT